MKLIICRGLPGSGKSTLARKLQQSHENAGGMAFVYSTDNLHYIDGEYVFQPEKLSEYHRINLAFATEKMSRMIYNPYNPTKQSNTVIIDNTNITFNEMKPYILVAIAFKIPVVIIEPQTEWKYDVEECAKRNTHCVPIEAIKKMRDRWETTENCIRKYEFILKLFRSY